MAAVRSVAIIGAGTAGCTLAVLLAEAGVAVDVVDLKVEGDDVAEPGITLQGNGLRVLRRLGVWDQVRRLGYAFDTLGVRAPDAVGTLLFELRPPRSGGFDLPAMLGLNRTDLALVLRRRAVELGARLRFGVSATDFRNAPDGVEVEFGDGSAGRYDLLVGADGADSWTRGRLGLETGSRQLGAGVWRVLAERPLSVGRTDHVAGGPSLLAGYCPTGPDTMYVYFVEPLRDVSRMGPAARLAAVRRLAAAYHGPWDDVLPRLVDPGRVSYTRLRSHLVPPPWHRDRVTLIGDAVHLCPPTLAQGASQALEDADVLAAELLAADRPDEAMWQRVIDRRLPRARAVVHNSVTMCERMLAGRPRELPSMLVELGQLLAVPA